MQIFVNAHAFWIISFWHPETVIIFLNAHLHMIPNLTIKFHLNPLSSLGEVLLRRNVDSWTDKWKDRQGDSVCRGYKYKFSYWMLKMAH